MTSNSLARPLGGELLEQSYNRLLGCCQIPLRALELVTEFGELRPYIALRRDSFRVSHIGAAGRPDIHKTLGLQHAKGCPNGVPSYAVLGGQLPVRGQLRARLIAGSSSLDLGA